MGLKLYQRLGVVFGAAAVLAAGPAARDRFLGWHLPLPAGDWVLSRGPCGSAAAFDHDCGYYENQCAIDVVAPAGSMQAVPVLAPAAGQVFFRGQRSEAGLMLMLRHPDGRISAYMHLARITAELDDWVAAGQVIGYAGRSGTSRPHLHFFVQPNAAERTCLSLVGLDGLAAGPLRSGRIVSKNLPWAELTLVDPPESIPDWLPAQLDPAAGLALPRGLVLRPGESVDVPVWAAGAVPRHVLLEGLRAGRGRGPEPNQPEAVCLSGGREISPGRARRGRRPKADGASC